MTENLNEGIDTVKSSVSYKLGANVENLTLIGSNDAFGVGNAADNIIIGNSGSNNLDGGAGNDLMQGGAGNDIYIIDSAGDIVDEQGNSDSRDAVIITQNSLATIFDRADDFVGIEQFQFSGSVDWTFTGDNNANIVIGGDGKNFIFGGGGDDEIAGGDSNDMLHGDAGADLMSGGYGNDIYYIDDLGDDVFEKDIPGGGTEDVAILTKAVFDAGYDTAGLIAKGIEIVLVEGATATGGNDFLVGTEGDDVIDGAAGNDVIYGLGGNDKLIGGTGDDKLRGGAGNDTYVIDSVNDNVDEQGNTDSGDTVIIANDALAPVVTNSSYITGIENWTFSGSSNWTFAGDAADNIITGGSGDDVLTGGGGNDTLIGGGNAGGGDTAVFSGAFAEYSFASDGNGGIIVTDNNKANGDDGTDLLLGMGYAQFNDKTVSLPSVIKDADLGNNSVIENTTNPIALVAFATDFDGAITYSLSDDAGGRFLINSGTGQVSVKDALLIDYEANASRDIVVRATNIYGIFTEKTFTIDILDGVDGLIVLDLAALDSKNGTNLTIGIANELAGIAVSGIGDVNGDGLEDIAVSAAAANRTYVVFGKTSGLGASFDLGALDGSNGFQIDAAAGSTLAGITLSGAGDVNGDGIDDFVIGSPYDDPSGRSNAGSSYLVLGKSNFSATLDLGNSANFALRIDGAKAGDQAPYSLATIGDVNGDGYDDILIGSARFDSVYGTDSGAAYIIYGKAGGFASPLDLANLKVADGVRLVEDAANDLAGFSVSSAGDFNGDGIADIIIGVPNKDVGGFSGQSGSAYVVLGETSGGGFLVNGKIPLTGIRFDGNSPGDFAGASVAGIGDINGDGFDDVFVGAPFDNSNTGAGYVLFGKSDTGNTVNPGQLTGKNGFIVNGLSAGDYAGYRVSAAGDINADGYDDFLISAPFAQPGGVVNGGSTYVVFGTSSFALNFDLSKLDGANGFRIDNGGNPLTGAGTRPLTTVTAAGDVNGDGFDDLVVGDQHYDQTNNTGRGYVIYGKDFTGVADFVGTTGSDTFNGTVGADIIVGGAGNDVLNGLGGADAINGGVGNDAISVTSGAFFRVDGGTGIDTLIFNYSGPIDFSNLDVDEATSDRGRIQNVEILNFANNNQANSVFLYLDNVLDMSSDVVQGGHSNVLTLTGTAADSLTLSSADGWVDLGGGYYGAGATSYTILVTGGMTVGIF